MMKKLFAAMLCLMMLSAASLCAADTVPDDVCLPLVEQLVGAQKVNTFFNDDQTRAVVIYEQADEDSLDEFLMMCPMCGIYPMDMGSAIDENSKLEGYFLIQPGSAFDGYVLLDPENGDLSVDFSLLTENVYIFKEESAQALRYMYDYDMKIPSGSGGNIAPQFYAVVNRQPFFDGVMDGASFAFDGASCWVECYDNVEKSKLGEYATIMGLFGFDVMVDSLDFSEDGRINPVLLHFDNGDAEILLLYNADEKNVTLYYEPGVTYNLLDGGDLNEILPQ